MTVYKTLMETPRFFSLIGISSRMPLTPFHLGFAWPTWMLNRRKLHFMSLSFGAMVPDLEVPVLTVVTPELEHARGLMHSYLGALTLDILVTLFIVYFIVPPVGRWFRGHTKTKWHIFAGIDVTKAPSDPLWASLSALIGTLSHVTLDALTHPYNPIFWPYMTDRNINFMPFGDSFLSSLVFMIPLGIIVIVMALLYWTKPAKGAAK
jgi:membrane-bound metal-dependent hydrolase YbcI (DUF457 family)